MLMDMSRFHFAVSDGQYNGQLDYIHPNIHLNPEKNPELMLADHRHYQSNFFRSSIWYYLVQGDKRWCGITLEK